VGRWVVNCDVGACWAGSSGSTDAARWADITESHQFRLCELSESFI